MDTNCSLLESCGVGITLFDFVSSSILCAELVSWFMLAITETHYYMYLSIGANGPEGPWQVPKPEGRQ